MTDQPPDVAYDNTDQPTNQVAATDRRPTDQTPLTLEDAAAALGITVNAVRQRVKRGTLAADKTTAGWVVFLTTDHATSHDQASRPTDRPTTTARPGSNRPADQTDLALLAELVADVTRRNEELAAAAALWQYRAMRAEERLAQLEAGPIAGGVAPTPQDPTPPQDAPAPTPEPERPGWRRWLVDHLGGSR